MTEMTEMSDMNDMTAIYAFMLPVITKESFSRLVCNNDGEQAWLQSVYLLSYNGNFFEFPDSHECNNKLTFNLFINEAFNDIIMTEKLRALFGEMIFNSKMSTIKYKMLDHRFFDECLDELHKMRAVLPHFDYLYNVQMMLDFSISRSFQPPIISILVSEGAVLSQTHIQYMVQKTVNVTAVHQNGLNYTLNPRDMGIAAFLISMGLRYNNCVLVDKRCFGMTPSETGANKKQTITVMDYIRQCDHPKAKWFYELILKS